MGFFKFLIGDVFFAEIDEDKDDSSLLKGNHPIVVSQNSIENNDVSYYGCTSKNKDKKTQKQFTKIETTTPMEKITYANHHQGERKISHNKCSQPINKCTNVDEIKRRDRNSNKKL